MTDVKRIRFGLRRHYGRKVPRSALFDGLVLTVNSLLSVSILFVLFVICQEIYQHDRIIDSYFSANDTTQPGANGAAPGRENGLEETNSAGENSSLENQRDNDEDVEKENEHGGGRKEEFKQSI